MDQKKRHHNSQRGGRGKNPSNRSFPAPNRNKQNNFKDENNNPVHKEIHVGLNKILDTLKLREDEILLKLVNPHFGYENYLQVDRMGKDLVFAFTELLVKAFKCNSMRQQLAKLIIPLPESNFVKKHLYEHIGIQCRNGEYNLKLIREAMELCQTVLEVNPGNRRAMEPLKDRIELLVRNKIGSKELLEEFVMKIASFDEQFARKVERQQRKANFEDDLQPPNNISEMCIVPDLLDIVKDEKVFLRRNITNGAYRDVNHYLDVQFRLLREDFMSPLRGGVKELRSMIEKECHQQRCQVEWLRVNKKLLDKMKKIDSLNVYFDVRMRGSVAMNNGVVYAMQMHEDKAKKGVNWEKSKKLMFGSLVCLSSDFFTKTCLVGTVCERDVKRLEKESVIFLKFDVKRTYEFCDELPEELPNQSPYESANESSDESPAALRTNLKIKQTFQMDFNNLPKLNENYLMLETSAYFESYKHVLQALVDFQKDGENDFPFKENIVYCQNKVVPPPRFLQNSIIDFRPLVDKEKEIKVEPNTGLPFYKFSNSSKYAEQCPVDDETSWPSAEKFGFDQSQFNAMKLALTSRLALIQGPPGTGKTYIGVKLVQLLLHNRKLWWNTEAENTLHRPRRPFRIQQNAQPNFPEEHRPILMICYTNHALDQFLELIMRECQLTTGVVRVGGRCKTESLEPFLLGNIKGSARTTRTINADIFHRIRDECRKMKVLEEQIKPHSDSIELSYECLLSYDVISQLCDNQNYLEQLKSSPKQSKNHMLLLWLGFLEENFDKDETVQNESKLEDDLSNAMIQMTLSESPQLHQNNEVTELKPENASNPNQSSESIDQEDDDDDAEENERKLEEDYDELENLRNMSFGEKSASYEKELDEFATFLDAKLINRLLNDCRGGWKIAGNNNEKLNVIRRQMWQIQSVPVDNNKTLQSFPNNLWDMEMYQRFELYNVWARLFRSRMQTNFDALQDEYNQSAAILHELRMQEDRSVMQDALIVAMTTTGSARYHAILKDLKPRIVIVEEAAEVFEAHIVSSLTKHCEHLILIGDHVQLRPNPTVYQLAREYKIDVSLFERLLNNDVKKVMLTCQHRMRPEISALMPHFYGDSITDHASVFDYPAIRGLKTNFFFINHCVPEKVNKEETSKSNLYEVEYLAKLCGYLVKQGYDETRITILSMYLGQLMDIRQLVKNKMNLNVKISTVDNYQGEENDIVLLSLVRSNPDGKIGFLAIENRVCVALSRAKHGFFVIGNFGMLGRVNEKWRNIIQSLDKSQIGTEIAVTCTKHTQNDFVIKSPSDFDRRPEGGCQLPCDFRLKCGHVCKLLCHNYDVDHVDYKCPNMCNKVIAKCGHVCKRQCSHKDECSPKCGEMVDKVIKACGHAIRFRCDTVPTIRHCQQQCVQVQPCGHACNSHCHVGECAPCPFPIEVNSVCKHAGKLKVKCSDPVWKYPTQCQKRCDQELNCGHICRNKCGDCYGGRLHGECVEKCERPLICGHKCGVNCATQCPPCQKKCENRCIHSSCQQQCGMPCAPCKEKCTYQCKHKKCTKLCSEVCNREPCEKPCPLMFQRCKHPCIGFCGEPCPPLCRICHKDTVGEIFFGDEDEPDARFVYLLDCKHIVESRGMDRWLQSLNTNEEKTSIQLPECPKCKTPIRQNYRYSTLIKRQQDLIEVVKSRMIGDKKEIKKLKTELELEVKNSEYSKLKISTLIIKCLKMEISMNDCLMLANKWKLFKKVKEFEKEKLGEDEWAAQLLMFELAKLINVLSNERRFINRSQEINDVNVEIKRVERLVGYFKFKLKAKAMELEFARAVEVGEGLRVLNECLVEKVYPFEKVEEKCEMVFGKLKQILDVELSEKERVMIVKAIGLQKGHWFKCPNGHVYCIGECGGAMEKSKCPECKATIGGANHALAEGNQLAAEMDGAAFPAWSDQANNN